MKGRGPGSWAIANARISARRELARHVITAETVSGFTVAVKRNATGYRGYGIENAFAA
jgi:hypothetical protein